jgi:uncharacterized SAM-binding protein YcdF (DUF218 family)
MDTLFFYLSKIGWTLVQPDAVLVYVVVIVTLLLWLNKTQTARRLLTLLMLIIVAIAALPISYWLYSPLEKRFAANPALPGSVDGIILLGGTIQPLVSNKWNQVALGPSAEREVAFAALARQYPNARLLMTGGSGNLLNQELKEADLSPRLLRDLGLDSTRVVFERDSRNTYENALNGKPLMQPKPGETWLLITSAFHMPRAVGVFCGQGWPVLPWPVDYKTAEEDESIGFNLAGKLQDLDQVLHEWLGLVAYRVTGKTPALLPSQCPLS